MPTDLALLQDKQDNAHCSMLTTFFRQLLFVE